MRRFITSIVVSVLLAVLFCGCGSASGEKTTKEDSAKSRDNVIVSEEESTPAKIEFSGIDMDGNEVSSDLFAESKLTMINVWATYCNPCLREMPELSELVKEYDAEEFQLIGIISDVLEDDEQEMKEKAAGLIEQTGADYAHLLLNEDIYYALLTDVSAVPTTFFVDEEGEVLDVVVGAREKAAWKEIIDELLEK